jgi:argininosuccinate synthase
MNRTILAYSGAASSTAAISRLRRELATEIVTVTLDVGQGREVEAVRDRAVAAGASRAHVLDARDEFVTAFVLPALQAGATYAAGRFVAASLVAPLVAAKLLEVATIEGARTIAFGGARHEPLRRGLAARAAAAGITWVPARPSEDPPLERSTDGDVDVSGRAMQIPRGENEAPLGTGARPAGDQPGEPALVEIAFESGVPVALNGIAMPFLDMIATLSTIAGTQAIGRVAGSAASRRQVYDGPAAAVLHAAHARVRQLSVPDVDRVASVVAAAYADLITSGGWFLPLREALDRWVASVQTQVAGSARVKLFQGACEIVGAATAASGRATGRRGAAKASRAPRSAAVAAKSR